MRSIWSFEKLCEWSLLETVCHVEGSNLKSWNYLERLKHSSFLVIQYILHIYTDNDTDNSLHLPSVSFQVNYRARMVSVSPRIKWQTLVSQLLIDQIISQKPVSCCFLTNESYQSYPVKQLRAKIPAMVSNLPPRGREGSWTRPKFPSLRLGASRRSSRFKFQSFSS